MRLIVFIVDKIFQNKENNFTTTYIGNNACVRGKVIHSQLKILNQIM